MANHGYKKYMKKDIRQGHPLFKIFIVSFFGMLLLSTFVINSFAKKMSVDTSIGDYKEQSGGDDLFDKKIVDNRLEMIQNEDQGKNFSDLMKNADTQTDETPVESSSNKEYSTDSDTLETVSLNRDTVYKVFIGSYTTVEQAKVAKEIIQDSGSGFNPIVKCLGSNSYTLQVGIFKNKQSAENMLYTIQKANLPGRMVQEN